MKVWFGEREEEEREIMKDVRRVTTDCKVRA